MCKGKWDVGIISRLVSVSPSMKNEETSGKDGRVPRSKGAELLSIKPRRVLSNGINWDILCFA